jgi:hypothetical protein
LKGRGVIIGDEMSDEGESGYCNPFLVSEKKLSSPPSSVIVVNIPPGECGPP